MRPVLTDQQLLEAGKSLEDKYRYTRPDANWELKDTRGPGGTPVRLKLTGDQALATLPEHSEWQAANPEKTILNRYRYPEHPDNNTGYQLGKSVARLLGGDNWWKRQTAAGRLRGGLAGGLGGLALGGSLGLLAGGGMLAHRYATGNDTEGVEPGKWARNLALLLGAGGLAAGVYAGHQHMKKQSSVQDIIQVIQQAPGLSFQERARLIQAVSTLDPQDLSQLERMLAMAGGAGVGALITRFLAGKGKRGILLGAVLGGVVARNLMDPRPVNAFGQRTQTGRTFSGVPF